MEAQVKFVTDQLAADRTATLLRYRTKAAYDASPDKAGTPFGAHAMLVGWTMEALEAEGCEVDLIWAERVEAA